MLSSLYANSFRHPLGSGAITPLNDGDGYYVAFGFDEPNPDIGGSFHLGADWNGEGGGNSDLGEPVYAIGNATVVSAVTDQGASTSGFGNYVVLRHDFSAPRIVNGQTVTHVHSLYAHLENVEALSVGQQIGIGQQIGTLGSSGYSNVAHLHLEITLGDTLPTADDGYNPAGAPSDWVDPVAFVTEFEANQSNEATTTDLILAGTFLARVSYGGQSNGGTDALTGLEPAESNYFYDYQGYLDTHDESLAFGSWRLLRSADLVSFAPDIDNYFSSKGLYIARPETAIFADENLAEALLAETTVGGQRTLVLSFRGSDGEDAAFEAQTWTGAGIAAYYNALRPLVEAAREYAVSNGINSVVVSGHSLGGTMADTFTLVDARSFQDLDINLTVVSLASAGVDVDLPSYFTVDAEFAETDWVPSGGPGSPPKQIITSLNSPAFHHDLSHADDRVRFPEFFDGETDGLTFNNVLTFNRHFQNDITINLPNIGNLDVEYPPNGGPGFGALHNDELYWVNWYSLLTDPLFNRFTGSQNVVIGISDYNRAPDLDGSSFSIFRDYSGLSAYGVDNDQGARALSGDSSSDTSDFILGLTGNDQLFGYGGADLLSGGEGDDAVFGDAGADILSGGSGTDRLVGGSESDVFSFQDDDYPLFASVNPDRITDFNQGNMGSFSASEGDLVDLSGFQFATSTGFGTTSTVRLQSTQASGGLPAGAILEVNTGDGIWRGIARLDNLTSGQSVLVALTDAQAAARTGAEFQVDRVGDGTSWTVTPHTQNIAEGDVAISFMVTRSDSSFAAETVYVSTVQTHGSFNDGDYVGLANVAVPFAAGDMTKSFTVQINPDAFAEPDETFGVIVQADPNDPVSTYLASAAFTIEDGSFPSVSGGTYIGDGLDNNWSGTNSADLAFGNSGNDTLDGRGGNDILFGGDGNDWIEGGAGDDVIVTGTGANTVDAGSGNDFIETFASARSDQTVVGGDGDDVFLVRRVDGGSTARGELVVDGGNGFDLMVLEVGNRGGYGLRHQFLGTTDFTLDSRDTLEEIEAALSSGGTYRIENDWWSWGSGSTNAWVLPTNVEAVEYRGSSQDDLFLAWGEIEMTAVLGGGGIDTVYADWSDTTADIIWNLTVDNEDLKTLGNGIEVQSVDRLLLKTGSGDDNLVLGDRDDHVETGAGDDVIVTGTGANTVDAGSGNDFIATGTGNDVVDGGSGDDVIVVGGGSDEVDGGSDDDRVSVIDHGLHSVDGGSGVDLLRIDLSSMPAYRSSSYTRLVLSYGDEYGAEYGLFSTVDASSSFEAIAQQLESVEQLFVMTHWNGGGSGWGSNRSVEISNVEILELVGGDANDLFVDGPAYELMLVAGGLGIDALYADWSATTANIVWNLTVDNDTARTLGNGVTVQSIERVMLKTGSGDDNLVLGGQSDHVETDAGDDVVAGGGGNDTIDGGVGLNDTVVFSGNRNEYDISEIASGRFVISHARGSRSDGVDTVDNIELAQFADARERLSRDLDFSDAPGGVDVYLSFGLIRGPVTVLDFPENVRLLSGSNFDDRLVGDEHANVLVGGAGNDILKGKGGDDQFEGGDGDDRMRGGEGDDSMYGGAGSDILVALAGVDHLDGGADRDFLYGGRDADTVIGGAGDDEVRGNLGNDDISGNDGADDLRGGGGNDAIAGGADSDYLFGDNGQDVLDGGAGDDSLTGGYGSGVLDGLRDTFVFASTAAGGGGFDRIKDWENGVDVIDLSAFGFTDFASQVLVLAVDRSGGLRIDFGGGNVLFVEGFEKNEFDVMDVVLS